jgi:hypothetical protein
MHFRQQRHRGCLQNGGRMAEAPGPNFSVMKLENGWFWTSRAVQDVHGTETMIGPFPSQEEAEKDARPMNTSVAGSNRPCI